MKNVICLLALAGAASLNPLAAGQGLAQDATQGSTNSAAAASRPTWWLQIEAQPSRPEAEERARAWAALFADVSGFATPGWFTIALGPFTDREAAAARLRQLKDEALVPDDSFLSDGAGYRAPFWPPGNAAVPALNAPETPVPTSGPAPAPALAPAPVVQPTIEDESPAQARAAEAALDQAGREAIQSALQWFGHYTARVDGAFGPGTRASIAGWQAQNGHPATGVLTTRQRNTLLNDAAREEAAIGLRTITEAEAGITIALPTALVEFDHYEPPFVHYRARDNSDVRVILISQPGDQATLYGLYDLLQSLELVPLDGPRSRAERSFTIDGQNAEVASHSYAELSRGLIKGYMLIWNPENPGKPDSGQIEKVQAAMQASFRSAGDKALDPGIVALSDQTRSGLMAGLELRRPALSRSGFYVDVNGTVATVAEVVEGCNRITLDLRNEARVVSSDPVTGLALLSPLRPLAPPAVAELLSGPGAEGQDIAVAGYSYEDKLPAPVLTWGRLEEMRGLDGETSLARLAMTVLPGDAGGPVLDTTGTVVGMLLPAGRDGARRLPDEVHYALQAATLAPRLSGEGVVPRASARTGAMASEDLTRLARDMTVLVSCW